MLNFRNACRQQLLPEDALPKTTKDDPENHGFGLASIRSAAEKYGGQMSLRSENGEFVLTLLFPEQHIQMEQVANFLNQQDQIEHFSNTSST